MTQCEVCGNDYDKTITVIQKAQRHTFDCFECAIQALAPVCSHCGCRVIGHGVEAADHIYCCASCATKEGVRGVSDRLDSELVGGPEAPEPVTPVLKRPVKLRIRPPKHDL